MTQALTLSGPQSKSSSYVPWFLLLLWPLVTITLLLIYGLCFLKLPVKTCLLLMTTDLHQDNNDAVEKAMAPHSSPLAWKIPWTEEPGGLQSMGSRRVGHDCATSLSLFTFMHWRRKWQPAPGFLPGESQGWGHTESGTHDWSDLAVAIMIQRENPRPQRDDSHSSKLILWE